MKKIFNVLYWLLIITLIGVLIYVYKTKFFNDYLKTMKEPGSTFERVKDIPIELKEIGYSSNSYKINSESYNNALFYKTISVKKNTPYKVTCYIKTEDVKYKIIPEYLTHGLNYIGGANISLYGENERSEVIYGTNDWKKVEFIFNSKDKEMVDIAFRLGTDMCDAKGSAYFADIKVEEGIDVDSSDWNFGMFIFKNIDVSLDGRVIKESINEEDIELLKQDIDNFKSSIKKMSKGKIDAKTTIHYIDEPITEMTYDVDNGYYVDMYNIYDLIKEKVHTYEYDHIFIIFKSDDLNIYDEASVDEVDWVGLGGMYYNSIGYSNIRLPITYERGRHMFMYDRVRNTFPEDVFIHEFLHSLEIISNDLGYENPSIHDYKDFGYKNKNASRLKSWYTDFLNKEVTNEFIAEFYGFEKEVFVRANPSNNLDFINSIEIEFDKEPENIIDGIKTLVQTICFNFKNIIEIIKDTNTVSNEIV